MANFAVPYMSTLPFAQPASGGDILNIPYLPTSAIAKAVVFLPIILVLYGIYLRYGLGVSHIPGPFIASISNYWKIQAAWKEQMPQQNIDLHKKYGPLVRVGPNMISVDDPTAMNQIYGFKPIYQKVRTSRYCIHGDLH
jgi:hypothetical protein